MGKAAAQRRMKRMKYLVHLAEADPERFDREWERRVSSWIAMIGRDAGVLRDEQDRTVPPVFDVIDEALAVLKSCGEPTYSRYAKQTFDLLSSECCSRLAVQIDPRLFRLNGKFAPHS